MYLIRYVIWDSLDAQNRQTLQTNVAYRCFFWDLAFMIPFLITRRQAKTMRAVSLERMYSKPFSADWQIQVPYSCQSKRQYGTGFCRYEREA
jgi:hypothetical protein